MELFKTVMQNYREPKGKLEFTLEQNIREALGYAAVSGFSAAGTIYGLAMANYQVAAASAILTVLAPIISNTYYKKAIIQGK